MASARNLYAETTECNVISSMPATIDSQGVYCFKSDQVYDTGSGNAITINVNNVTIDFNGFKLGGLGAGPSTTAHGVYASGRKNIVIKGANIRGYYRGVYLAGGEGHIVEDSSFDGNTLEAIYITAPGAIVRNNRIVNQVNETIYTYGIYVSGTGALIDNNFISSVTGASGYIYGIVTLGGGATIRNNTVIDVLSDATDRAIAVFGADNIVKDNQVANPSGNGEVGIINLGTNGYCTRNQVLNFADANSGCTDGPDNYFPDTPAAVALESIPLMDSEYVTQGQ